MAAKLTEKGLRRIAGVVEDAERGNRNGHPIPRGRGLAGWNPGSKIARVNAGGITASSTATPPVPGSGTARLWDWSGSALVDSGIDVTVYNLAPGTGGAIAATTWVVASLLDGDWFATWVLC